MLHRTLKEKQDEIERKKLRAQQQKEKLVNAISVDGLWQTDNAVEAGLLCYPSVSRKIVALKQQINFRKFVLVQEASDKALFSFSKDKKQHSLEQLKQNLVRLISETQDVTESPAKRGRNQGGEEDPVIQNPELLVGKRVVHYFEEDGTRQGYNGLVTGLVPGTRTWFNISYDAEGENEIHTFELLDDYREGDLEILDA
ncbi:Spindlin-3 [Desmophyllum pertusum]|uniref:Spindlin-3 n=1 Tax=Desmophyllum pertusum TaxID=174260 RepID=A0A9X0CV48_9CNID|nr:Spindlin-3 [Desmophyllum pertusum]